MTNADPNDHWPLESLPLFATAPTIRTINEHGTWLNIGMQTPQHKHNAKPLTFKHSANWSLIDKEH